MNAKGDAFPATVRTGWELRVAGPCPMPPLRPSRTIIPGVCFRLTPWEGFSNVPRPMTAFGEPKESRNCDRLREECAR